MAQRVCSECPRSLAGKRAQAKTCSETCRLRRSRRLRRALREEQEFAESHGAGAQEIAAIVRRESPDVIHKVMREQLQPIVREALNEEVLRAVNDMVGLTPAAVAALQADLGSDNDTIRQRAYSLVIKYTVGHPALVRPDDEPSDRQLVVNFNLPRPDDTEPQEAEATELRTCDMCNQEKPEDEFVAGSERCRVCFEDWKSTIEAQFA